MASNLKGQVNLAKNRAQELMDFNNAAASNKSDQILSILEAGEGSSIARDQLDQFLHNYIELQGHTPTYNRAALRQCLSIKEKVALIAAEMYINTTGVNPTSIEDIRDVEMRITLDETIRHIEEELINNRDFTESWILRNAAMNRFQCELSVSETNELNEIGKKTKELCTTNGLDALAESTHFTNESDAQKIMKLSDILRQISASGVVVNDTVLKGFEKFDKKIEPLRTLDKHYEHVTKTLNMLHRVAQKGYHAAIKPQQQKKLDEVLAKTDMLKTVNDAFTNFNTVDNFSKNEEHGFLENLLAQIKASPKYKETLSSISISDAEFNERFISSSAFALMERARLGLHSQKGVAFGAKMKDFEADTQSRRGLVRRRLFDIAERMAGNNFGSETDFQTANSYFNKFKDLFFAKEEDNYRNAPNAGAQNHYDKMANVVSALVRRRVPALASGDRIRRGSAGRVVYKFIENALKGKERGIYEWIRRMRHNADDATVVAMVIMAQNEATNQVFYQDQDKTKKADNFRGKLWNKISFAENGRAAIRDKISPTVNKALTFTEEAVKKGLQLSAGVAKVGNKIASQTTRGFTRGLGKITGKYNAMIEKGGYKRWKTPLYLPYILSKPGEAGLKLINQGATYTNEHGSAGIDKVKEVTGQGYDEAKKLVGKATGEETNYLFQGLTKATEEATSLVGKTVSASGQRIYDSYDTEQRRGILGAFYGAAQEQKGLEDLMQSSELGEMLNLKERGPYLFDKDGRIVITEGIKEKYPEDQTGEKNIKKDVLGKKHDEIQQQFNAFLEDLRKKYEALDIKMDNHTPGSPEYEAVANQLKSLTNTMDTWNDEKSDINDIMLIIQQVAIGAITDDEIFNTEISNRVSAINTKLTDGENLVDNEDIVHLGYKQQIKKINEEINKKNLEKKEIDDKLSSIPKKDASSLSLRSKKGDNEIKIKDKKKERTIKQSELGTIKSDIEGLTENNNQLKKEKTNKENRLSELREKQTSFGLALAEFKAAENKLKDDPTNKELKDERRKTKEKLDKANSIFGGAIDPAEVLVFIESKEKRIKDDQDTITKNIKDITNLKTLENAKNGEIEDLNDEINKLKLEHEELHKKLLGRGDDDKSRTEYDNEKMEIEQKIAILEAKKGEFTQKITKQDEKNKVYRKLHRRGKKVENLAKTLADIHANAGLNDKEKSKLCIKTIKGCDIDFELKKEISAKFDRDTLSAIQKKEMADLFGQKNNPVETTT